MTPDRMMQLFGARRDDYATQSADGRYRRMGSPLTNAELDRHLAGHITVGAYQLDADGNGIWLCLDLDAPEREWLEMLRSAAIDFGIPRNATLREFSGNKGYHLWVFFSAPVGGGALRKLGEIIREKSGVPSADPRYLHPTGQPRQLVEVYPKTVDLTQGKGMGQLVKLPLGIHRKSGKIAEPILDDGDGPVVPMDPELLGALLEPWGNVSFLPSPPVLPLTGNLPPPLPTGRVRKYQPYPCTPGLMAQTWGEGGRNVILFALAKRLNVAGYSEDEIYIILLDWQGTHFDPALTKREVRATVRSAMGYTGMDCLDPNIVPHCVTTCPIYLREHPATGQAAVNGVGPKLRLTSTIPVQYSLPLAAGVVIMSAEDILNWDKVRQAQAAQLPNAPSMLPRRSQRDWDRELDALMLNKEVVETPEVTSIPGVVHLLIQAWCGRAGDEPAQVERRNVWLDDASQLYVFQGDSLIRFVQNIERGAERKQIWRIVEEMGGRERKRQIPGELKPTVVWELPVHEEAAEATLPG